jgi:hypothetical protein
MNRPILTSKIDFVDEISKMLETVRLATHKSFILSVCINYEGDYTQLLLFLEKTIRSIVCNLSNMDVYLSWNGVDRYIIIFKNIKLSQFWKEKILETTKLNYALTFPELLQENEYTLEFLAENLLYYYDLLNGVIDWSDYSRCDDTLEEKIETLNSDEVDDSDINKVVFTGSKLKIKSK